MDWISKVNLLSSPSKILGNEYKAMYSDDIKTCGPKSIQLWVGEKDTISSCKRECDDNEQCKFMFYGTSCILYSTCEDSKLGAGKTYYKKGIRFKKYLCTY